MTKRIHAFFSGSVQGIGFRFITNDLARKLKVYGWVKNLEDSRVELVAEGEEKILKEILKRINQYFSENIKNADIGWQKATGEFEQFEIKF